MPSTLITACTRCAKVRHITGRGLCGTCHTRCTRPHTLADYPRSTRPTDETAAEYQHLHDLYGLNHAQVAERLGMKPKSLHRALQRAQNRMAGAA
jgi:predicted DNA-binding protein (UPF0251 family)